MFIGLDGRPTQGRFAGDSTYWRGLIDGLSHINSGDEFIIYLDAHLPEPKFSISRNIRARVLHSANSRIWSGWTFPNAVRDDGIQVAHVQYTIPPRMLCPTVTTIHDVSFKRYPEFFSFKDRWILNRAVKFAKKHAARIIAPSDFTKSELVALYGVDPEKITVTYEGHDDQFRTMIGKEAVLAVAEKYGIESAYVLTVGVIQPRKNLHRLLEGFAQFKTAHPCEHKLVIVGKYGWMEAGLEKQIEDLGLADDVLLTGYVPYEDLPALYSAADVFVYPSVYEGFGLPPVEAMACGTPVITGNQASLPEIVGEAGLMVDPFDSDAFADALERVLFDRLLRAEMFALGLDQVANFSWDAMARRTLEIYHEIAEGAPVLVA